MNGRSAAALVVLVTVTSVASWFSLDGDRSAMPPLVGKSAQARYDAPTRPPLAPGVPAPALPSSLPDPWAAYAAMRDEINPKPRLQLIDAWARQVAPGDNLDLLTHAMVDPDESVRERARFLFDREVTKSAQRVASSGPHS